METLAVLRFSRIDTDAKLVPDIVSITAVKGAIGTLIRMDTYRAR